MNRMTVEQLLSRARSALAMPTLYWLRFGGWTGLGTPPKPQPGTPIQLKSELKDLAKKDLAKHQRYLDGAAAAGIDIATLPPLACDCSGYVAWCLGVPRSPSPLPGNWLNTNAIHADVSAPGGQGRLFRRLQRAVPGALLVHPGDKARDEVGHVAIVTAVDDQGRATRMLHCAPENLALPPPAGGTRNAIAETDASHFDGHADTRIVMALALDP